MTDQNWGCCNDLLRLTAEAVQLKEALKEIDRIATRHERGAAGQMQRVARGILAKLDQIAA